MSTRNGIAAIIAVFTLSAAAPAQAGDGEPNKLLWNCAHAGAPGLTEVKQLFDTANNHYASLLRERLQARLRAECQRGARQVLFVLDRPVEGDSVAVARAAPGARVEPAAF